MMQRKKVRRPEDGTDVNITPLLDIVFIMLIFFIVTATFVSEDGFAPNLPEPTPPEENPPAPPPTKTLYIQEDGFVRVDDVRLIDPKSVKPVVDEFFATNPEGLVQITASPNSKSGVAVTVLDQARQAKIDGKIIITKAAE